MMRIPLSLVLATALWDWIHRFGGPGLILVGLIDNSVIPLPGGMDLTVIILTAHRREWWPYYAFMATVGAVVGGYLTYRLAEKGGEETLEREVGREKAEKVYKRFEKRGFLTVTVAAVLPPPFPLVPVLMAAGVLQYPRRKFLLALSSGRTLRFFAVAYLAHIYGRSIAGWMSRYYEPLLYSLIGLAVAGGIGALFYFKWYRPKIRAQERQRGEQPEQFPVPGRRRGRRAG